MPTPTNKPKSTQPIEEEPIFRRKEDKIKFEITNKVISLVKWLIVVNGILLYFFYSVTSDNKKLTEYQMRIINDLSQKIEAGILQNSQKNINIPKLFLSDRSQTQCASCHNSSDNFLRLPTTWDYKEFHDYVRGVKRIPSNTIMPQFSTDDITDKELELIYFEILKQENKIK